MRPIHLLFSIGLLLAATAASAQQTDAPILITGSTSKAVDNTQTNSGSACASGSIGACQACSAACPTSQSAICMPGVAALGKPGNSCVTPPECKCQ